MLDCHLLISGLLIARTELQRRSRYMQNVNIQLRACGQLRGDHPLIRLIQQCLHNSAHKRPNIGEVLGLLEEARAGIRDEESERNRVELVRALQNQPRNQNLVQVIDDLVTENAELQKQLTRAEETVRREQQQMRQQETEKDETVQAKDRELAQAQQQLRQQEQSSRREIGDLQRQLKSIEALVADFQKTLQQRDSELETLRAKSTPQAARPVAVPHSIVPPSKQRKLIVQCHKKKTAPREMWRGSATTDDQFAYFTPDDFNLIYSYQWNTGKWKKLPPSPCRSFGLAIIDGELAAVGGYDEFCGFTNKLFTLRQGQWVEHYPPMNTARSMTTVVSTSDSNYIVVIGGYVGVGWTWTATVELFHVRSRRWYDLAYLPMALTFPSATICDNQIYLIGSDGTSYSCSLQALLSSDQPITSQSISNILTWKLLPQLPVKESAAATLCGQLVTVGGMRGGSDVNSIHQLLNRRWVEIGSMSSGRERCLVVTPSPDKMMIVGGYGGVDSVEECVVLCNYVHEYIYVV